MSPRLSVRRCRSLRHRRRPACCGCSSMCAAIWCSPMPRISISLAKRDFEKGLGWLSTMSAGWNEVEAAEWVGELAALYQRWVELPPRLFELHDSPLKNRPALRLARVDVQARRVEILTAIETIMSIRKARQSTPQSQELLATLERFQTSFDAVVTNIMAYGASGEINFKLTYGPQLAANAASWNALIAKRDLLSADEQTALGTIARS